MPASAHLGRVEHPETRLHELAITLPAAPAALGEYPSVRLVGDLLYTTAVLPMWNGDVRHVGAVGSEVSLVEGAAAARLCGLNLLALVRAHAGSLDNVRQVVQVIGLVNSSPGFAQQSKVMNGLSELLYEVFGEAGRHNRTALSTLDLPLNATVQASAVIRLDLSRMPGATGEPGMAVSGTAVEPQGGTVGGAPVSGAPVDRSAERSAGRKGAPSGK
ncbi:MAG TPA: RidA family protein [Candidatus Dormibacteraeota bacterium]|nr:RidA family protein [Candidatus Dormibacteraeota bacterium]